MNWQALFGDHKMSKFSFSFAKKLEKPQIKPTQPQFEPKDRDEPEEQVELITSISNNQIETKEKPVEKKELVIQLQPNQNKLKYKRIKRENETDEDLNGELKEAASEEIKSEVKSEIKSEIKSEFDPDSGEPTNEASSERATIKEEQLVQQTNETVQNKPKKESLNEQAKRELLEEATGKRPVKTESDLTIGLSKAERPDQPDEEPDVEEADYSKVSVEEFGMALLRGMAKNPDDLKQGTVYEPKTCLGGVGLGFESRMKRDKAKKAKNKRYLPGQDDDEDEEESAKKRNPDEIVDKDHKMGSLVCVEHGEHEGHYGKIVSITDDLLGCTVKLMPKNEVVSLPICLTRLVSQKEYNKESKVLNRTKYDQYNKSQSNKSQSEEVRLQKEQRGGRSEYEKQRSDRHREERHRDERDERRRDERRRTEREEDDRRRKERSSRDEFSRRDRSDEHRKRDRSHRDRSDGRRKDR